MTDSQKLSLARDILSGDLAMVKGSNNLKKDKCTCQHHITHPCNARFCWCYKHWGEKLSTPYKMKDGV